MEHIRAKLSVFVVKNNETNKNLQLNLYTAAY